MNCVALTGMTTLEDAFVAGSGPRRGKGAWKRGGPGEGRGGAARRGNRERPADAGGRERHEPGGSTGFGPLLSGCQGSAEAPDRKKRRQESQGAGSRPGSLAPVPNQNGGQQQTAWRSYPLGRPTPKTGGPDSKKRALLLVKFGKGVRPSKFNEFTGRRGLQVRILFHPPIAPLPR